MRRDLDDNGDLRRVSSPETRTPLWRRLVTVLVAAAFTAAMISLGLMRHRHIGDDNAISHQTPLQIGGQP